MDSREVHRWIREESIEAYKSNLTSLPTFLKPERRQLPQQSFWMRTQMFVCSCVCICFSGGYMKVLSSHCSPSCFLFLLPLLTFVDPALGLSVFAGTLSHFLSTISVRGSYVCCGFWLVIVITASDLHIGNVVGYRTLQTSFSLL